MSDLFFGWEPENEEQHTTAVASYQARAICSAPDVIPDTFDFTWIQRDQRRRPFCHAHMRGGMEEVLCLLGTRKQVQFSRYFDAITDMRMDGNDSRPAGASISGSLRGAIKFGSCLNNLMPYLKDNEGYSNRISTECMADAAHHHIASITTQIRSYDQWKALAITGRYVLGFGLDWTEGLAALSGVRQWNNQPLGGSVLGGHAVMSTPRWITVNGDKWFPLDNSHYQWGRDMKCFMPPKFWDRILGNSRFGAWAASDITLDDISPQPIDFNFDEPDLLL